MAMGIGFQMKGTAAIVCLGAIIVYDTDFV